MQLATVDPAELAKRRTKKPLKVTGKVAEAVDLMVEQGLTYQQAAERVGMHVRPMRKALEKPHVISYLRHRRQVFRASICAANDLRLAAVRDTAGNTMAVVQAIRALEQLDAEPTASRSNAPQLPGLVVQIINNGPSAVEARVIEPDATD